MEVVEAIIDLLLIDAAAAEAQEKPVIAALHSNCIEKAWGPATMKIVEEIERIHQQVCA